MLRRGRWCGMLTGLLLLAASGSVAHAELVAVSGSWVAHVDGVRVAVPGRDTRSQAFGGGVPPGARIAQVAWQYTTPAGAQLDAWLCHPQRCLRLDGQRGRSEALAGLSAAQSLHFRFRLRQGARPVQVSGLQVIVDHRQ